MDARPRTGGFVVAGVIGVAVGAAVYAGIRYFGGAKDAARAEGGAGDAGDSIDAIYSLPGAYAFDLGAIPVLRGIASPPATSVWLASTDSPLAQAITDTLAANAAAEGLPLLGGALLPPGSTGTLLALANALEHQDPELLTPDAVAASVWIVLLHPDEPAITVAAAAAALAKVRAAQPSRRIVWLMAKSTPPTYAKAINERTPHEEWFRATSDDAAQAAIDWAVLTAPTADALSKLAAPATPGTLLPMSHPPVMLGALPASAKAVPLSPDQDAAWSTYFRGFADQLDLANDQARGWYDTLRQVLADTGQPLFQASQMRDGMPIAWTKELDQQFLDVSAMAAQVAVWLREVADGKRAAILQGDDWGVEALPGDPFHIAMDPANNLPVMVANGQIVHETEGGDVGAVGAVPWVIIGIGIVAGVAVTAIKGYVLFHLITGIRSVLESIAAYQQSKVWAQCVQTAKDPTTCVSAIKALEDLQKARNEGQSKLAEDLRAFASIAKWTVAGLVVLVGGYLAIELVPPMLEERKHARAAAT